MQLKVEDLGACRKKIRCEVPAQAVNEQMDKYFSRISREVKMPGFRQGKVPMSVIRTRFSEEARQETTKEIISSSFQDAIRNENLRPVLTPAVENFKQEEDKSMSFDLLIEVEPTFELKPYSGLNLERKTAAEPSQDEVNKFIEGLRESRAVLADSATGKVGWDDYVLCDYSLSVDGRNVEERNDQWLFMARRPEMEGFLAPLEGQAPGAVVEGSTTLSPEFPNAEVAGKNVSYRFEVKQVKNKTLPALDEEFSKSFGLESVDDMRTNVAQYMTKEKETQARQELEEQVVQTLVSGTQMTLPEQLFKNRVETMINERMKSLVGRGAPAADVEKAEAEIRKASEEEVTRSLKLQYIVSAIFEKEKMELSEKEVFGRLQAMLSRIDPSRKDLMNAWQSEAGVAVIADNLRREKVMDKIISLAQVSQAS